MSEPPAGGACQTALRVVACLGLLNGVFGVGISLYYGVYRFTLLFLIGLAWFVYATQTDSNPLARTDTTHDRG